MYVCVCMYLCMCMYVYMCVCMCLCMCSSLYTHPSPLGQKAVDLSLIRLLPRGVYVYVCQIVRRRMPYMICVYMCMISI
jgi:hypothetical protein